MTEKEFADKFQRCVMLLGMGTAIILSEKVKEEDKKWWLEAIEEVIYKNNPIPTMPKHKS